jgi:hypothetical protein
MPPKTLQIRNNTAEFLIFTKQAGENGMGFQCRWLRQPLPQSILQYSGQTQTGLNYLVIHPFGNTDCPLDCFSVPYLGANKIYKFAISRFNFWGW